MTDWDAEAATFDDEPDHGLADPATREAWRQLLAAHLPMPPSDVVDLGCGTGTLSVLLADAGHHVRGLDLSPAMVERARDKATDAGHDVAFTVGDAAEPPYDAASADVVLCRHVLWALPEPAAVLRRWVDLLRPGGRLVLVEGRWHTGAGLAAADLEALVVGLAADVRVLPLEDELYWGGPITDERYLLVALPG
ncbi:class I SAM-dependent methyltransferase [Nocardioides sp.]|uniref:class I SAM-dependent methyltransferase n=1 Tax=Nocardioides sp. TaxID=35761 RepID=UPI0027165C97|nr:class I SAM-dependent methyltransferase [Nocardioides sp.]MDO9455949.1 class I SAM-dependent methyltransferase [Nocardioides sp.]